MMALCETLTKHCILGRLNRRSFSGARSIFAAGFSWETVTKLAARAGANSENFSGERQAAKFGHCSGTNSSFFTFFTFDMLFVCCIVLIVYEKETPQETKTY